MIFTTKIDAEEGWCVEIIDILKAFIQERIEDKHDRLILCNRGVFSDIMMNIYQDIYRSCVTFYNKVETLF